MKISEVFVHQVSEEELYAKQKEYSIFCHAKQPMGPTWLNCGVHQWPIDLIYYQDLLYRVKPNVVIETGTSGGGRALYLHDIYTLMQHRGLFDEEYKIITMDIRDVHVPFPPEIVFIHGDSLKTVDKVKAHIGVNSKVMVMLDSDHSCQHVLSEMELYCNMISRGSYLIAEDTSLDIRGGDGGPLNAVNKFLSSHPEFEIDYRYNRWIATSHPNGYLYKK